MLRQSIPGLARVMPLSPGGVTHENGFEEVSVKPPAPRAQLKNRHKSLMATLILVVLPTLVAAWYLWTRAADQYVATVAFSVRNEDSSSPIGLLGGLSGITGTSSPASDTDILYDYLQSEDIVSGIDRKIDMRERFSKVWPRDFVFGLDPSLPIEDLTEYWKSQVKILYDTGTQLITLKVHAFSPEDAKEIAEAAFGEASDTINRLSDVAREDATRNSRMELLKSQARVTESRKDLTSFQLRTQMVDPTADLSGRMEILSSLEGQLSEAQISLKMLAETTAAEGDLRVLQAERRILAIQSIISEQRSEFSGGNQGSNNTSYAQIVAEYLELAANLEFNEAAYRSAQTAYDLAVAEAQRQSRYLAAHIQPNIPESSVAPLRFRILSMVFGSLCLSWAIIALIYYSLKDRR